MVFSLQKTSSIVFKSYLLATYTYPELKVTLNSLNLPCSLLHNRGHHYIADSGDQDVGKHQRKINIS